MLKSEQKCLHNTCVHVCVCSERRFPFIPDHQHYDIRSKKLILSFIIALKVKCVDVHATYTIVRVYFISDSAVFF